jgi:hypothetical protein
MTAARTQALSMGFPPCGRSGYPEQACRKGGPLTPVNKPALGDFGHFVNGQSRKKGIPFFLWPAPHHSKPHRKRQQNRGKPRPSRQNPGRPLCLTWRSSEKARFGKSFMQATLTPSSGPPLLKGLLALILPRGVLLRRVKAAFCALLLGVPYLTGPPNAEAQRTPRALLRGFPCLCSESHPLGSPFE